MKCWLVLFSIWKELKSNLINTFLSKLSLLNLQKYFSLFRLLSLTAIGHHPLSLNGTAAWTIC